MIPPPPRSTLFPYTTLFRSLSWSRRRNLPIRRSITTATGSGSHGSGEVGSLPTSLTADAKPRSEEHTSELQSLAYLVCRLLLEKKKNKTKINTTYTNYTTHT